MVSSESDEDGHSMWSRPFTFGTLEVRVLEEWGLGIGGTVWEGGVLLAQYLSSQGFPAKRFVGRRCLEIGAGITGLPSIAVAHLNTFRQIVVTDIEECIDALKSNLQTNLPPTCHLRSKTPHKRLSGNANGWDVPQSVVDVATQELGAKLNLAKATVPGNITCPRNAGCVLANGASPSLQQTKDAVSSTCEVMRCPAHLGSVNGTLGSNHGAGSSALEGNWGNICTEGTPGARIGLPLPLADPYPQACTEAPSKEGERGNKGSGRSQEASPNTASCISEPQKQQFAGCEMVVETLDWRDDMQRLEPPFDLLLVADVVYIAELMEPLLKCMHQASGEETLIILAYYERSPTAARVFWDLLPQYFVATKIPEGSFGAKAQADNIGLFTLRKLSCLYDPDT